MMWISSRKDSAQISNTRRWRGCAGRYVCTTILHGLHLVSPLGAVVANQAQGFNPDFHMQFQPSPCIHLWSMRPSRTWVQKSILTNADVVYFKCCRSPRGTIVKTVLLLLGFSENCSICEATLDKGKVLQYATDPFRSSSRLHSDVLR